MSLRQDVYPCPDDRMKVVDVVADIGHNAVDEGVDPMRVASALREAADEIEYAEREREARQ